MEYHIFLSKVRGIYVYALLIEIFHIKKLSRVEFLTAGISNSVYSIKLKRRGFILNNGCRRSEFLYHYIIDTFKGQ